MRTFLLFIAMSTLILTGCESHVMTNSYSSFTPLARNNSPSSTVENPQFWQQNSNLVWNNLQQVPLKKLTTLQNNPDPEQAAWIKLAIISKRDSMDVAKLSNELSAWRTQYPNHPGNQLFPNNEALNNIASANPPKNVAVLLPLSGKYAALGNETRNGFMSAYFQKSTKNKYQQNIVFYDTNQNPSIAALYQQAINKGADVVIGPLTKEDVKQLSSSGNYNVPTITLNYTDLESLPSNFYQFGLSPQDEIKQIADKAWASGTSRAIIIASQNAWGQNLAKTLASYWQANGGKVSDTYFFANNSNLSADIPRLLNINTKADRIKTREQNTKTALSQQRRQDFDVIFLLAMTQNARQIVPLLRFYYVEKEPIYATSAIYSGIPNPQKDADLNGVIFCDTPSILLARGRNNRLSAVGQDAYTISHNLARFTELQNFPLYGATGAIHLNPQKKFYRRLAWAQFHNGQP